MALAHVPVYYMGGGFPWGLLIIGGILYFLWRNGMFGGPGRHWNGPGQRWGGGYGQGYGSGYGQPQAPEPPRQGEDWSQAFHGGPRAVFDEWHRQAHAADAAPPQAPAAPPAPPAPEQRPPSAGEPA
jgi:hypothetical protein